MKHAIFCLVLLTLGCSGKFTYRSDIATPSTLPELREFIATETAELEGLEAELLEAKASRDLMAKAAETADWWNKDSMRVKLRRASTDVEWAADHVTDCKKRLARAKARLKELENDNGPNESLD